MSYYNIIDKRIVKYVFNFRAICFFVQFFEKYYAIFFFLIKKFTKKKINPGIFCFLFNY